MQNALGRIRTAARKDKGTQFTALLHHVTVERLRIAYWTLNPKAAAGTDDVTWEEYGKDIENNLQDLHGRIHRGGYRAKATRRAYIPKPDGRKRPLGIASLEDKIVQAVVAEVLNAIYEADFWGFSYGFRPGRNPHQALDALAYGIYKKKVNWVLDADICGYFDAIHHEYLMELIGHRIGDKRILRLIRKWLNAGVLEDGTLKQAKEGTPQGATISPLLANIYLHYVFDEWAHHWRQQSARGDVVIVRYADDMVVGFQYRAEAEQFLREMRERFRHYSLELHPEKTRLIEFGRFARKDRKNRGEGKPETFNFLGFTHISAVTKEGKYLLRRHTIRKRLANKIKLVREDLKKRMHQDTEQIGRWLRSVVHGYYNYHAVPTNLRAMKAFRREIAEAWLHARRRRSQRDHTTWEDLKPTLQRWLPPPQYRHPWPEDRMKVRLNSR
jgi:group II intron reverse transcriptase/maturase